mgnify:FL=1
MCIRDRSKAGVIGRLDQLVSGDSEKESGCEQGQPPEAAHQSGLIQVGKKAECHHSESNSSDLLKKRLLGRVWVIESISLVRLFIARMPPGLVFLDRTGNWLSSDGGFEAGASSAGAGLVSRHSELRTVKIDQQAVLVSVRDAKHDLQSCQKKIEDLREEQRGVVAKQHELAESIASSRSEQQRFQREIQVTRSQVNEQQQALHEAEARAVEAADAVRSAATKTEEILAEISRTDTALTEVESNLESLGQSHEQVLERIEGFRDQLLSLIHI